MQRDRLQSFVGNGEKAAQSRGKLAFGLGTRFRSGSGGAGCFGARIDHGVKRFALMGHIALHRFHQIGNEIGTALELHVNTRPALAHHLPVGHQRVVDDDGVAGDADHEQKNDPFHSCAPSSNVRRKLALWPGLCNAGLIGGLDFPPPVPSF